MEKKFWCFTQITAIYVCGKMLVKIFFSFKVNRHSQKILIKTLTPFCSYR
jgi:hypothetical protein